MTGSRLRRLILAAALVCAAAASPRPGAAEPPARTRKPQVAGFLKGVSEAVKVPASGGYGTLGSGGGASPQKPEIDRDRLRRMSGVFSIDAEAEDPTAGILIKAEPWMTRSQIEMIHPSLKIFTKAGSIFTGEIPIRLLGAFDGHPGIVGVRISEKARLTNDRARSSYKNGGLFVGVNAPNTSSVNLGSGTIIGIVDTGIDFRHPDFIDPLGTTRIMYLWDQSTASGPDTPPDLTYGTKYTAAQINTDLANTFCLSNINNCSTVGQRDTDGHGTHVAGSAGGDHSLYTGVAPKAKYIVVKGYRNGGFDARDVINGADYIFQQAAALGKPAVINMSIGFQSGPHDGTSYLETGLDALTGAGKIIVAAAGNDQAQSLHDSGSSNPSFVVTRQASNSYSWVDMWYSGSAGSYSVTVNINGSNSNAIAPGGSQSTTLSGVAVDINHYNNDPSNGDKDVTVEFTSGLPSGKTVTISFSGGSTLVHAWCASDLQFSTPVETHLTNAPASADNIIAVGALSSKNDWVTDTLGNAGYNTEIPEGNIYTFSSVGPTRDGRTKPDITAPGWGIGSSLSQSYSADPLTVLPGGQHWITQGTSMASPMITGIVALHLEQQPSLTPSQVRTLLQNGAVTDAQTGSVPNNIWGWGKAQTDIDLSGFAPVMDSAGTTEEDTSITWSWINNTVNHTEVRVHRASDDADLSGQLGPSNQTWTQNGLTPDTQYSVYVKVSNASGSLQSGSLTKRTKSSIPGAGSPTSVTGNSITANWTKNGNPSSVSYYAQIDNNADFSSPIANSGWIAGTSATFGSLSVSTQYHMRVKSRNTAAIESNYAALPSTFTTMNLPTAAPASGVSIGSITANWGSNNNPASVSYFAEVDDDSGFASPLANSDWITQTSHDFVGLSVATTYYFRVRARRPDLLTGPWVGLPADMTLATAPASANPGATTVASVLAQWGANDNPATVEYYAEVDDDPGFGSVGSNSGWTSGFSHGFTGLAANTTYYFRVKARNAQLDATPPITLPPAVTLAKPPSGADQIGVSLSDLTLQWSANGNPPGTRYLAEYSTDFGFGTGASSSTLNTTWALTALLPNTTYYGRIKALNHAQVESASVTIGTSTLAAPPSAAAIPFEDVVFAITANWTASTATIGYMIQVATSGTFLGNLIHFREDSPSLARYVIDALASDTTYHIRVGALNHNAVVSYSADNYLYLGSTLTHVFNRSSTTYMNDQPLSVQLVPPFADLTLVTVSVPPGTLPDGAKLQIVGSPDFPYATQFSNQLTLIPLSTDMALDISAGGAQPAKPVTVTMHYDPSTFPAGANPRTIVIANYRPSEGQWTILPTEVDTLNKTATAQTLHFSLFAPFFAVKASSLDAVKIYPIPWMPGSGDARFDHPRLTFTNLPVDAKVALYTILGEYVWERDASGSPMILWDGTNGRGTEAGSGTYLAVITGAGTRKVTRVVIVR